VTTPPDADEAIIEPEHEPEEDEETRPRRGRVAVVAALILLVAAVGIALLVVGLQDLGRADDARDRAAQLRRQRAALVARTDAAEKVTDEPIGGAERVANSVASVVEASDGVIVESAATNQLLSQAVRLANSGRRDEANSLYDGDAAASVRRLEAALARAQTAHDAAQQSSSAHDSATR
jgi:hypothetical protein